jgi:tetratricopeptide (TPR) repeat protein
VPTKPPPGASYPRLSGFRNKPEAVLVFSPLPHYNIGMPLRLRGVLFGFVLGFGVLCSAQTSAKPADAKAPEKKPDYSKEAFVYEEATTKIVFENDGTGTREGGSKVRIQSEAGVQRFGILTFPYQSAIENLEIEYVRVRKPDGSVVSTPADTAQDMPTEITRQAPFYSDLREKQVAVKGLSVGDVLEYYARWRTTKPLAPGQFWYAYNFSHDSISLHEQLQISVPRDRAVKWKSPRVKPVITEDAGRRIFTWTGSQLEHKSSEEEKQDQEEQVYQAARGKLPPPEIQISSFQSWDEIGNWYNGLQLERVKPSDEIRAKAAELTKGAADDNAKMHAIYNYVSTQFRYIGVAFGIGRYQPHSAADVMSNQYGDCKDKHTLLASLLDAAGIKAYPALINVYRDLDSDVPSPAQFDHVITAVPRGNSFVWLDATAEVAPFGYLVGPLRDKSALVIPSDRPSTLITTAADPPMKAKETFKIEGKLKDDGTLDAKVERSVSGDDVELMIRSAFRRVPLPQWKDLVQQISYNSGFAGDVSEVTASSPERTDDPFHFAYTYHRKDYPDWSERRISSPLPPMLAPAPDTKPSHPILLGAISDYQYESRVELPKGYSPQLPANVELKEDFAEYRVKYSVKDGTLQTERTLIVKLREVPVGEYEAYKKFAKAVSDDHELYVALSSSSTPPASTLQNTIASLPASDNAEAMRGFGDAVSAGQSGNMAGAIASLNQAVKADPKFTRAWMVLAEVYAASGKQDLALETLREAHDADPHQPVVYKALVTGLMGRQKHEEAVSVLQDLVKTEPANSDILSYLGGALLVLKRYDEASAALKSAIKLAPDRANLHQQLGSAYLHAGKQDKASEEFKKAIELDSSPGMLNDVGYELADANLDLPLALQYTEKAVHEEEEASATVTLSDLKVEDLAPTSSLAAFWDSLGWAYFRLGDLDHAEKYLEAACALSPKSDQQDHLGQLRKRQPKDSTHYVYSDLTNIRKLPRLMAGTFSAEFFVILARDQKTSALKVGDTKFVSGSEKLRSSGKALSGLSYKFPLPDEGPTRLLRRGILGCYAYTGCSFVLLDINDVHSVN